MRIPFLQKITAPVLWDTPILLITVCEQEETEGKYLGLLLGAIKITIVFTLGIVVGFGIAECWF